MNKKKSTFYLVPLILLLTIVPLIVYMYGFHTGLAQFDWNPPNDENLDFFLYYKSVAITVIAAAMCILLAYRYKTKKKEFRFCYEFIPVIIYAGLTFLSSVFSEYRYFSFHGASEVFETLWVVLGYCVIAFYAYEFVNTFEDVDCVMKWMTIGLGVMLVLGVAQAAGYDFFTSKIGRDLISQGKADELGLNLTFEKGRVFLSVYNPNYVASYFALLIPMEITLLIKNKQWTYRVIYVVMLVASLVCLLASGNRSGIVAFAVTGILVIVLFYKKILKAWKFVVPGVAAAGIVCAVFISKNDLIIEKFIRLFSASDVPDDAITKIVTEEDIAITYHGEEFHTAYEVTDEGVINMSLYDGQGQSIQHTLDETNYLYTIQDERFPGFTVQAVNLNEEIAIGITADNIAWYFKRGDDNTYYYYNVFGRWDKINNAPRVATKFLEKKFEERGTIWSKTIPMLKNCIFFGTGADTYTVTYPQDDYVNKVYDGSTTALDVKPHCFYLQVATQSGIPALIAVLVFYIWYFITSLKLYAKATYQDGMEIVGAGLMCATFTYMVISFLNDSTVSVAPIFWIMMGIGVSVNEMVKKSSESSAESSAQNISANRSAQTKSANSTASGKGTKNTKKKSKKS
jgi:energy-coupling factor transporter transmembrane protein EcfT